MVGFAPHSTNLYIMVKSTFWYTERFRHDTRVWRTYRERWTDILIANAAVLLHCVANSDTYLKMPSVSWLPFNRSSFSESVVWIQGSWLEGKRSCCMSITSSSVPPNIDGWIRVRCNTTDTLVNCPSLNQHDTSAKCPSLNKYGNSVNCPSLTTTRGINDDRRLSNDNIISWAKVLFTL